MIRNENLLGEKVRLNHFKSTCLKNKKRIIYLHKMSKKKPEKIIIHQI